MTTVQKARLWGRNGATMQHGCQCSSHPLMKSHINNNLNRPEW